MGHFPYTLRKRAQSYVHPSTLPAPLSPALHQKNTKLPFSLLISAMQAFPSPIYPKKLGKREIHSLQEVSKGKLHPKYSEVVRASRFL